MNQYQCFQCGMILEDGDVVKDHLRLTHNVKVDMEVIIRKYSCQLCQYSTTNMEDYKNHLIKTHNKEKHNWMVEEIIASFVCEECDFEFPTSSELLKHKDLIHCGDKVVVQDKDSVLILSEAKCNRITETADSTGRVEDAKAKH